MSNKEVYKFEILSLVILELEHQKLLNTARYNFPNLTDSEIVKLCSLVIGTCGSCYNEGDSCQCWNDE